MTKVENRKSDLSVISSFEYERDRTGNPLSILREDGSCVYYEYDLNQQLTAETQTDDTGAVIYAWEWDYDRAGNRLWQTFNGAATYYTYNAGNELVTEVTGGATTYYNYDRNGNQTAKQAVDGTTYFHYDFENLLRQIDLPDGAHNYFTYDADSKRVSAADSTGYTRFIYQGPDMLKLMQEKDAAGETQAQYTMGVGLESMRRGEASSFFHYDALGSTQELTDATETVTDTYRYNAWGEMLAGTGTTPNPHKYVGRERYYEAGLLLGTYQLGFRYYDSVTGRFISVDPVGLALALTRDPLTLLGTAYPHLITNLGLAGQGRAPQGLWNLLAYVGNEPVERADPLGLWWPLDWIRHHWPFRQAPPPTSLNQAKATAKNAARAIASGMIGAIPGGDWIDILRNAGPLTKFGLLSEIEGLEVDVNSDPCLSPQEADRRFRLLEQLKQIIGRADLSAPFPFDDPSYTYSNRSTWEQP